MKPRSSNPPSKTPPPCRAKAAARQLSPDELKADEYLSQRGSSLALAKAEGSQVLDVIQMSHRKFRGKFAMPAISFPCADPVTGTLLSDGRVRYLSEVRDDEGRVRKFNLPPGAEPFPYIAFKTVGDWPRVTKDVSVPIHITEGETRALALARHQIYCVAFGGVDACFKKETKRGELVDWFKKVRWKNRTVYLAYDADAQSNPNVREARRQLAVLLQAMGAVVHIVDIPALFGAHAGIDDVVQKAGVQFYEWLCSQSKPYDSEDEWPEPKPFYNTLPPVPAMTPDMLPDSLRDWVVDDAERMGVRLEAVAVPALFALSVVTMTRCAMRPKDRDNWRVWGILWCCLISRSGSRKSSSFRAGMSHVLELEEKLRAGAATDDHVHKAMRKIYEKQIDDWAQKAMEARLTGKPEPPQPPDLGIPKEPPPPPTLTVNSVTVEALQEHLKRASSPGIGYIRDELAGLIEELEKPGREGDRSFLLEGLDGAGYKTMRIGRGETCVPKNAIAIGGTIQPDRMRQFVDDGLKGSRENDGLLPRFGCAVYPDKPREDEIKIVNRNPNLKARERAAHVYERIQSLSHTQPTEFTFDAEAQREFLHWLYHAECFRRTADLPPILESHFSKYDGWIPTLAMLFKLADAFDGKANVSSQKVEKKYLRLAFKWAWYLELHAHRVYHIRLSPARSAAQSLATKIQKRGLKAEDGCFTVKEVYDKDWTGLSSADEVRAALKILADYDWVVEAPAVKSGHGGRPPERYALNPKVTSNFPVVNTDKFEIVEGDEAGGLAGLAGGRLVPARYWEEEEKRTIPQPAKPAKPRRRNTVPTKDWGRRGGRQHQ